MMIGTKKAAHRLNTRAALLITALCAAALLAAACGGGAPAAASDTVPVEEAAPAAGEAAAGATPTPVAEEGSGEAPAAGGPASERAPQDRNDMYSSAPEMTIDPSKYYYATINTDKGAIRVQLFADRAPVTVNNFVYLAREGFYDGTTFHRVLDGFMAQAGDPTGTGMGGPGYMFEDEFTPGLVFDRAGLLAMANSGPGTNGSQFFITFAPTEWLNERHTIFGEVIEGSEVLNALTRRDPEQSPASEGDKIISIEIEETDSSVLPTPTPLPPPTPTPTPYAPSSMDSTDRPLAALSPEERVGMFNVSPEVAIDPTVQYTATIATSQGDLVLALFADKAPTSVNNFVTLANLGFYDGTPINQVTPGEVLMFGAPDNQQASDAGYRFPAEAGLDIELKKGAVAYVPLAQITADSTVESSSSQVLFALLDLPAEVNMGFAFFGQVTEGLDVLDKLTMSDMIESVTITSSAAE